MFTVSILINGHPLVTRSCRNTGVKKGGKIVYKVDDGGEVLHDPDDGAKARAKKLTPEEKSEIAKKAAKARRKN